LFYLLLEKKLRVTKELEHQFVKNLEEHQNIVHKVCRVYTTNSDAHKDLFQEITIQLWRAYPKFRGDSKFSTWMYRVALNTAITMYRKSKREIKTNDFSDFHYKLKEEEYDPETDEQMQLLYKAIHQLTDINKALILLYLEDKPYKEIAQTIGITEVNARVKVNRIKDQLKKILNP
jgi:RNA polymerase sigma-70 factor, ECF subfamily